MATVTCGDGTAFTLESRATLAEALALARLGLGVCEDGAALERLTIPESGALTEADLEEALGVSGARFATAVTAAGEHYAAVTCENGAAFRVGPEASFAAAVAGGLLGLRACADAGALAHLTIPASGMVTQASLEGALAAATPAPEDAEEETQSVSGNSYRTWSSSTWSWWARCNIGDKSGSGSGYSTSAAAGEALFAWAATANCPAGGGKVTTFKE